MYSLLLISCGSSKTTLKPDYYQVYSKQLGVQLTGTEDLKLMKVLVSWLGTPYKYGGKTKSGSDCSGFVGAVYSEVYAKFLHRRSRDMIQDVKVIRQSNLKSGDLVFFKTTSKRYISHVGIYLADNKFIHASNRGVVVNDLDEAYYKKAYYKSGRVRSLDIE
jgi:cell wall-associated NlpC family hydrolase